ncbi:hypothetical protein [Erwinia persicina]|uniref:Uncharacterized protein n=1 Tax=Erwinia persicina TaxID=55211 RepID=A0ABR8ZWZ1_9GAMM|nr:hypothetical protein [Erwinia persicina]MBC3944793.1 hypothetical protein [Erwinia persicina]MBD8108055.1 hypothetical protein [Erwinia persicina]MBD8169104.1 hypothetical protein [Erwinia persicina]MBD8211135.1 hypothetical protein [Erwinia persicina]MCQ4095136.1 hypothetical protein [Erwinia persicina]
MLEQADVLGLYPCGLTTFTDKDPAAFGWRGRVILRQLRAYAALNVFSSMEKERQRLGENNNE